MAVRRFGEGVLAEEAALAVIDGLKADNWSKVRAFNEKASFTTFVRTLTVRLLEDFARKRFGRLRPPLWVKTFGGFWEKLFIALCQERLPVTEAVEVVFLRHGVAGKSEIETAAYQLLARIPDCGKHQGLDVPYDEEKHAHGNTRQVGPDHPVENLQKTELIEAIVQLLLGVKETEVSSNLLKKIDLLQISLAPDEKLLLKLCYQDGFKVATAGEMLGLSRFQAHGKMRRLMARLKKEFERTGLAKELRILLDL